ncbi:TlpA family protein disulfide reductase [Salipaludibacillus sp. CUR1]|uniref:TlpA disulfide reductase family protein n=1 Tax=Salipaludibacillus sp. CUR1 TaxID=2820003 RepID=UPI001E525768|nr:TlpA disulfide reductase family protein [Salipaludibacillus sp. CUR1]MCE7792120.1 TlpA family protein disulfide reductase [Salipaludibacillus sp. CUR1]
MKAPDFSLRDMFNSNKTRSLSDFKGKAVLLTFWVSWCPDCQRDLANKEQLYRAMQTDNLEVLMINVPGREHKNEAADIYYKENNFSFPSLFDNGTETYDAYRCMSVPSTFLLNKEHEIVERFNDKASFQQMVSRIGQVLSE